MKLFLAFLLTFLLAVCSLEATTVICFHGNGEGKQWLNPRAQGGKFVADMQKQGFPVLVAKSLQDKWNPEYSSNNPDIKSVLAQLKAGGFTAPYFAIGHSNGGGFLTRFTVFSGLTITAVQYSNASGIQEILKSPAYKAPSLFAYCPKDPVVAYADVKQSIAILTGRGVKVAQLDLTPYYGWSFNKHAFINTAAVTGPWFKGFLK